MTGPGSRMPEDSRPRPDPPRHPRQRQIQVRHLPQGQEQPPRQRRIHLGVRRPDRLTRRPRPLRPPPRRRPRKPAREPGNPGTPQSPGSPGPPPALPPTPGRAPRAITDSHTAPSPATTETSNSAADTPAPRRPGQRGKGKAGHPSERFCPEHAVGAPQIQECPYEHQPTRTGPGANERLTRSANTRHAAGPNRRTGPGRSWVSRTSTRSLCPATSTQPPFEAL